MWYIILIFCIVFQIVVTLCASSFDVSALGGLSTTVNSTVNVTSTSISGGTNPFETFGAIMAFQTSGFGVLSIIFWFLWVLIALCLFKLIRGS